MSDNVEVSAEAETPQAVPVPRHRTLNIKLAVACVIPLLAPVVSTAYAWAEGFSAG